MESVENQPNIMHLIAFSLEHICHVLILKVRGLNGVFMLAPANGIKWPDGSVSSVIW
jgi:hypothetical protein